MPGGPVGGAGEAATGNGSRGLGAMSDRNRVEAARNCARKSLELMTQHEVPPNPMNFTIWYGYAAESNPALKSELDRLLRGGAEFTPALNDELFSRHFGLDEDDDISETTERIQGAVSEVLSYIDTAGRDTSGYGEKVAKLSGGLDEAAAAEDLKSVVQSILRETEKIVAKTRTVSSRLNETSSEIAELRQNLETATREARTDPLTGIGNRKFLNTRLREEIDKAKRSGKELCLLLLDVDHFKKFNDTYGHNVGDHVLKVVARTLKNDIKGRDICARYGGEEFCIALPETELKDAMTVAEKIRIRLGNKILAAKNTGENYGSVTVSIGISVYRKNESPAELFRRADAALYRAKDSGRNKVVTEWMGNEVLGLTA